MIDYKKIKKYPATKDGKQVRTGDSIPISSLTEKTDTINNFEFFALDDTNLNQSLKLNLAEHSKQIGEANKVIDSDDIIVSEEIDNDLGKTQKLSIVNKAEILFLDITSSSLVFTVEQLTSYRKIIVNVINFSINFIRFPIEYDSTTNSIDIEINYSNITDTNIKEVEIQYYPSPPSTTLNKLANFVMIPKNSTDFPTIDDIGDYKISFTYFNKTIRNPRGIVMAQASSSGTVYGGKIISSSRGYSVVHSYNMVFFTNGNPMGHPRFYPTIGGGGGDVSEHSMKLDSTIIFFEFKGAIGALASSVSYGSSSLKAHIVFKGHGLAHSCYGLRTSSALITGANKAEYYNNNQLWTGSSSNFSITCTSFANPYLILAIGEGF